MLNSRFAQAHIKRTGTTIRTFGCLSCLACADSKTSVLIGESAPPAKHMNKVGIDVGCDGL